MGRLSVLLVVLTACSAQDDCDSLKSQSTYQACGAVDTVLGPDAPTCATTKYTTSSSWPQYCRLPYELRVGLTMSLTGPLATTGPNATTTRILEHLTAASSQTSLANAELLLSNGERLAGYSSCLRFCVMDDQSSEQTMVELYRSFVGADGSEPSVDFLLGPGSFYFRKAAAQVASEYQVPMLLWSLPEELAGVTAHRPSPLKFFEEITSQSGTDDLGLVPDDLGRFFHDTTAHTCASNFTPPSGYYLRAGAQFLECDGECDPVRDLDLCCRPDGGFTVTGEISPSGALDYGGWYEGCLYGGSDGTEAVHMNLTLSFGRSSQPVTIFAVPADVTQLPVLMVQGRAVPFEILILDELPDRSIVLFDMPYLAQSSWHICLRESCEALACPEGSFNRTGDYFCTSKLCDVENELDLAACCVKEADFGIGFLQRSRFTNVFDMLPPADRWAMDVLLQLRDATGENHLVCVAESAGSGFWTELCISYMHYAMNNLNYKTSSGPIIVSDLNIGTALSRLYLSESARPSVVLICSSLSFFASAFFFMQLAQIEFRSVVSWAPYDQRLIEAVGTGGSSLKYRWLEPLPWPSPSQLLRTESSDESYRVLASWSQSYQTVLNQEQAKYGDFPPQLLFLRAAWQVLDSVALSFVQQRVRNFEQKLFGRVTKLELFLNLEVATFLSSSMSFYPSGVRSEVSRYDFATQQFIPDPHVKPSGSPAETWQASMARYLFSVINTADWMQPIASVSSEDEDFYPCPSGCVVEGTHCSPCPPGSFRAVGGSACQPCPEGYYNDRWAGAVCFPCPEGSTCLANATQPPVADYGWFLEKKVAISVLYGPFSDERACSMEPGGGLSIEPATDMRSWDYSKHQVFWEVERCNPWEVCLGGNVCREGHDGKRCSGCSPGYSRYLRFTQLCEACPDLGLQLAVCGGVVALQLFAAAWLSHATLSSAVESSCLQAPMVLMLVQNLQVYSLLIRTAQTSFNLAWATWIPVSDILMTPFLLPLLDCYYPAESPDGVRMHILAILASASFGYLLIGLIFLVRLRRPTVVNDMLRHVLALNQVTLPCCIYWAARYTNYCSVEEEDSSTHTHCPETFNSRWEHPAYYLVMLAFLARMVEFYSVWCSRFDLNRINVRKRFGLLFSALQPDYFLWFTCEGTTIFLIAAVVSVVDSVTATILIFAFQFVVLVLMLRISPFWTVNRHCLKRTKRRVGVCFVLAAGTCAGANIFETWVSALIEAFALGLASLDASYTRLEMEEIDIIESMVDLVMFCAVVYVMLWILWKIFYNKFAFTWAIDELTGTPMSVGRRKLIHMLRLLLGLRSIHVSVSGESVMMDTKSASRSQRDDLLVSMRMALIYRLMADGSFRFTDVRSLLLLAVKGILRMHRSAWQKHFIDLEARAHEGHSNPLKGYGYALTGVLPGEDESSVKGALNSMFRANGAVHSETKIFPEEINAAVQDMCVTGRQRTRRKWRPNVKIPMKIRLPFRAFTAVEKKQEEEESEDDTMPEQTEQKPARQVLKRPQRTPAEMSQMRAQKMEEQSEPLQLTEDFRQRYHSLGEVVRAQDLLESDAQILVSSAPSAESGLRLHAFKQKMHLATQLANTLHVTFDHPNPAASALATLEQSIPQQVRVLRKMRQSNDTDDPQEQVSPVTTKYSEREEDFQMHCNEVLGMLSESGVGGSAHCLDTLPEFLPTGDGSQEVRSHVRQGSGSSTLSSGMSADVTKMVSKTVPEGEKPKRMRLPRWQPKGAIGRSSAQLHRTVQQAAVASP